MKVYELRRAPNARRVRMFLAEKGIEMEYQQVDLGAGENLAPTFLTKNPAGRIPVLELDDGTCLSETLAICRYFEELHPEPNLFGSTALERATIEMWSRFIEFNLWLPTGMAFRHITGFYKDRERVFPEWGEECKQQAQIWFDKLDARLAEVPYIAGERFTIADILAFCTIDFGKVVGLRITPEQPHLQDWHDRVSARSSAQA
ncbi:MULTISPECIES: glutathione S-transferase family protein [Aeromonas]|uniref:Glutathione S-transferase n=1 Tax=Aeromonas caviae TaxID=648 RepID=A0AAV4YDS2_AERCA|nr:MULTISPECIES: glutathione S-transferase family protein [Aeromonas]MEA9417518.1 glutathione S-transferase family protein [Aeromonas caviae]MEA9422231.1 glutathione S-transferase family protein [Aeromonas caviae]MEA9427559.1 glutathione S-transferase family protein [Aeromonas caviae]MEA9432122.1 glutathione S-transferase family protein [Aeromonas caviae]MEA9438229.1 glutathione S-transferase family protein [Aeromonas caviae]